MSPEQARGEAAAPAGDMFSFGLLLQHLFTERAPYSDFDLASDELIERAKTGATLPCTGVDPDLEALINRLKSPAPGPRPSALDTVDRLRWIRQKPARRRKRILASTALATVLAFATVMTVQTFRLGVERDRANREMSRANQEAVASREISEFLVELFALSEPSEARANSLTVREILESGSARVDQGDLAEQPVTRAKLMETMGGAYQSLGLYAEAQRPARTITPSAARDLRRRPSRRRLESPSTGPPLPHAGRVTKRRSRSIWRRCRFGNGCSGRTTSRWRAPWEVSQVCTGDRGSWRGPRPSVCEPSSSRRAPWGTTIRRWPWTWKTSPCCSI